MTCPLNHDILHLVISEICTSTKGAELRYTLISLSTASLVLRQAVLPSLFAQVHWPHKHKHDEDAGLHFYPKTLWHYFRHFTLQWPHEWLDSSPPRFGHFEVTGSYFPRYMEALTDALPKMRSLTSVTINCPFFPSSTLLWSLMRCPSLTELTFDDTPLCFAPPHNIKLPRLERVALPVVGEALRVGDGRVNPKYIDFGFHLREWKKRYRASRNFRRGLEISSSNLFLTNHASLLTYIQLSGDLCSFASLSAYTWPNLDTFILAGDIPIDMPGAILQALRRMPNLRDLRLLFSSSNRQKFQLLPNMDDMLDDSLRQWSEATRRLTSFAASTACEMSHILRFTPHLQRLALLAIIQFPRGPTALSHGEVCELLEDLDASGACLSRLRLMLEHELSPEICNAIASSCPNLEMLEIELCYYQRGLDIPPTVWAKYTEALRRFNQLRQLRICFPFPEREETHGSEPWKALREDYGIRLAIAIPSLQEVGFEYREPLGTHRYQDSWLDYCIERQDDEETVRLRELPATWYPFPSVWKATEIS